MKRHWSAFAVLVCLLAAPAWADENHNAGIGFSRQDLVKRSFSSGRTSFEVYATKQVDVASLLAGFDLSRSTSAQELSDYVNARRKQLFPGEEIILSIAPAQSPGPVTASPGDKASLVKAIYWWNNSNCSTCYWWALYYSSVATMVIDDIHGAYNIYDAAGSSSWVFRYFTGAGGSATRYSFGSYTLRGFKGAAAGTSSRADVVIYFFN